MKYHACCAEPLRSLPLSVGLHPLHLKIWPGKAQEYFLTRRRATGRRLPPPFITAAEGPRLHFSLLAVDTPKARKLFARLDHKG